MATDDYIPPPRSLLWANPVETEQGPGIELGCDCGTVTIVVIDGADQITHPQEVAATCDGCNSTRWITVGPIGELERINPEGNPDGR
jgi:hypothetical protein